MMVLMRPLSGEAMSFSRYVSPPGAGWNSNCRNPFPPSRQNATLETPRPK